MSVFGFQVQTVPGNPIRHTLLSKDDPTTQTYNTETKHTTNDPNQLATATSTKIREETRNGRKVKHCY